MFIGPAAPWGRGQRRDRWICERASGGWQGCRAARRSGSLPAVRNSLFSDDSPNETDSKYATTELKKIVTAFKMAPNAKLRVQQLLHFAQQLPPLPQEYAVPENQVPGCLSTVYVQANLMPDGTVKLWGDSDAQLTKGLVALLVRGLSGATPEAICQLSADFVQEAGLNVSLTPGRTNGFLNMIKTIKLKAAELVALRGQGAGADGGAGGPVRVAIEAKLRRLKPTVLNIRDDSAKHIGHEGARGLKGESHFSIDIVSELFEGLPDVKRHQMVYALLNEELEARRIHALSIHTWAPHEAKAPSSAE
ncbi:hypothetical protein CDCA_CDCA13G3679 [Cyanidium caldarium]|uniref:Fe-S metabolism associated domain-containing protein n=1 Tax=Cyanidium caldarium TaxID=2771 RepID=A0AAV9IZC2_CYACA|nr:hypothetical protein CDCA_CDCA13G3679 [Cyanidium caldarium]